MKLVLLPGPHPCSAERRPASDQGCDGRDGSRAASPFAHSNPTSRAIRRAGQELSLPPKIEAAQAKGFALWATRSVLSGRGDEVLDVAKTNLRQLPPNNRIKESKRHTRTTRPTRLASKDKAKGKS